MITLSTLTDRISALGVAPTLDAVVAACDDRGWAWSVGTASYGFDGFEDRGKPHAAVFRSIYPDGSWEDYQEEWATGVMAFDALASAFLAMVDAESRQRELDREDDGS